jgi:hypothetical protein
LRLGTDFARIRHRFVMMRGTFERSTKNEHVNFLLNARTFLAS